MSETDNTTGAEGADVVRVPLHVWNANAEELRRFRDLEAKAREGRPQDDAMIRRPAHLGEYVVSLEQWADAQALAKTALADELKAVDELCRTETKLRLEMLAKLARYDACVAGAAEITSELHEYKNRTLLIIYRNGKYFLAPEGIGADSDEQTIGLRALHGVIQQNAVLRAQVGEQRERAAKALGREADLKKNLAIAESKLAEREAEVERLRGMREKFSSLIRAIEFYENGEPDTPWSEVRISLSEFGTALEAAEAAQPSQPAPGEGVAQ